MGNFGYWGQTVKNWYAQGLPQRRYPRLPTELTTPASSLYIPAWTCRHDGVLPNGIGVMAGALYWPTQGFPVDTDAREFFGMDQQLHLADVNLLFDPMFEVEIIEDNDRLLEIPRHRRREADIPQGRGHDPHGLRVAHQRLGKLESAQGRAIEHEKHRRPLPKNWPQLVKEYRHARLPAGRGGYPQGFFGTLVHLLGYENVFVWYHDSRI